MNFRDLSAAVLTSLSIALGACSGDAIEEPARLTAESVCSAGCAEQESGQCMGSQTRAECEGECVKRAERSGACEEVALAAADCIFREVDLCAAETASDVFPPACDAKMRASATCSACMPADDTACEACLATQCCDTRESLYGQPEVFSFSRCLGVCEDSDDACANACIDRYPDVWAAFDDYFGCALRSCEDACSSDDDGGSGGGASS